MIADPKLAQCVLDFIDAVHRANDQQPIERLFEKFIAEFGFQSYLIAEGIPTSSASFQKNTVANGWPDEWYKIYARENLWNVDRVAQHALTAANPFRWGDASHIRPKDAATRKILDTVIDFRLRDGFSLPIRQNLSSAIVSISGDELFLPGEAESALHMAGLYAYSRISALSRALTPGPTLSGIEREALQWVAVGKTAWEISAILRIPEARVKSLLAMTQRKLKVANRTAAVVQALLRGEIKL